LSQTIDQPLKKVHYAHGGGVFAPEEQWTLAGGAAQRNRLSCTKPILRLGGDAGPGRPAECPGAIPGRGRLL
jgi:hypothetical protein